MGTLQWDIPNSCLKRLIQERSFRVFDELFVVLTWGPNLQDSHSPDASHPPFGASNAPHSPETAKGPRKARRALSTLMGPGGPLVTSSDALVMYY